MSTRNQTTKATTLSALYFEAAIAMENALPDASYALIQEQDKQHNAHMKTWTPDSTTPAELVAARTAVDADPLASLAMEMRRKGNWALLDERNGTRAKPEAATTSAKGAVS